MLELISLRLTLSSVADERISAFHKYVESEHIDAVVVERGKEMIEDDWLCWVHFKVALNGFRYFKTGCDCDSLVKNTTVGLGMVFVLPQ